MGVLYFTSWLRNQQSKAKISFIEEINNNADNLFIDANGTLYNSYNKCINEIGDNNINNLEDLIIKKTLEHYEFIINEINPKNNVYIAIDGIAPYAKITQQRIRRYTSYIMDKRNNKIINWSPNSNISPSTNFMKKFDKELKKYCEEHNYIYSSYKQQGEGEHKIIQAIKSNYLNQNNIIYSSDTDIIFLSLITLITKYNNYDNNNNKTLYTKPKNIYLFRIEEGKPIYFNVYKIKLLLIKYIKYIFHNEKIIYNITDNKLLLDFIIICFIIGNDFIQNIPFITAFKMNYIIKSYGEMLLKTKETILYLENNIYKIDYNNLSIFMSNLSNYELELFKISYFQQSLMNHNHINKNNNKDLQEIEQIREEQKDYNKFNNFNLINLLDDNKNYKSDSKIKALEILINYKYNYYDYYLHSNNTILINNILENYIEGFNWTVNYYFNTSNNDILNAKCLDWNWYYKFPCIPFISDISNYLNNNLENIINNINEINKNNKYNENNKPLTFEEQLIYIIPYDNLKNINKKLSEKLKQYKYLSPDELKIDTIHKLNLWCCHCLIPLYDNEIIRNII